mmetsp:Transcript_10314/g.30623  ORF Transcript_10314/g.30623 Transcript_10314/m.30623 type:complete len:241 (+) Transcript_10314:432-1154(+)
MELQPRIRHKCPPVHRGLGVLPHDRRPRLPAPRHRGSGPGRDGQETRSLAAREQPEERRAEGRRAAPLDHVRRLVRLRLLSQAAHRLASATGPRPVRRLDRPVLPQPQRAPRPRIPRAPRIPRQPRPRPRRHAEGVPPHGRERRDRHPGALLRGRDREGPRRPPPREGGEHRRWRFRPPRGRGYSRGRDRPGRPELVAEPGRCLPGRGQQDVGRRQHGRLRREHRMGSGRVRQQRNMDGG